MTLSSGVPPAVAHTSAWRTAIGSMLIGGVFFGLWFWLLPHWLGLEVKALRSEPWRWVFAIPSVLGFAVALRCVWDFGWTGHGTPAPIAPPKCLVVVGFYRYVRNPMYVGFVGGWIGLWVVFGHFNLPLAIAIAGAALVVHLFVVFYEEPILRKRFDGDYEEYCRNVRRWWPRTTGWKKA